MSGYYPFYEILDCAPEASRAELKRAYHRRARQCHPDRKAADGENTRAAFQRIERAWRTLGNPELKKMYDAECRQAQLEAECALVYARLKPEDLSSTEEDHRVLSYPCRCSGGYRIHADDLRETNRALHVPCQECTFVIVIET